MLALHYRSSEASAAPPPRDDSGHHSARRSAQEILLKPAGRVGSGQEVLEISSVGSRRVGSGRIRGFRNITGRAG